MNSLSKKYKNNDCTSLAKNNLSDDCCTNKIILKCGKPVSAMVQLPLVPVAAGTPVTVANVTVNTLCLEDPEIKLDFSFTITSPVGVTIANITFQVFKLCKNIQQKIPVGNEWSVKNSFLTETNAIFSFFVCDHDPFKSKCCTYIVEATPYANIS